ncbi:MAG: hypothetical protein ACI82S_001923 [Patiriisocius sp.]|jgi:hypothetical protein
MCVLIFKYNEIAYYYYVASYILKRRYIQSLTTRFYISKTSLNTFHLKNIRLSVKIHLLSGNF